MLEKLVKLAAVGAIVVSGTYAGWKVGTLFSDMNLRDLKRNQNYIYTESDRTIGHIFWGGIAAAGAFGFSLGLGRGLCGYAGISDSSSDRDPGLDNGQSGFRP